MKLEFERKRLWAPARLSLFVDGTEVGGRITVEKSAGLYSSFFETSDVGTDVGSAVSLDYHERSPFSSRATIKRIDVAYLDIDQPG